MKNKKLYFYHNKIPTKCFSEQNSSKVYQIQKGLKSKCCISLYELSI